MKEQLQKVRDMSVINFENFKKRNPQTVEWDFQKLFEQAVSLAHFEELVAPDQWYIATRGGEIGWMHRRIAERVINQQIFVPAVIFSLPYVIDLLARFARPEAFLNIGALALEIARREESGGSFQVIADCAFLRYVFGSSEHRRGIIRDYSGYVSAIGRAAYSHWAHGRSQHAGTWMAQAFRPLGDVVRAEIATRMCRQ